MDSEPQTQEITHLPSPQEEFGKFIGNVRHSENPELTPAIIQLAAQIYNAQSEDNPDKQVDILYHFTDNKGVDEIRQAEPQTLGTESQMRIYLTKIAPEETTPLMSEIDAKKFEAYLKGEKIPQNLKEQMEKFMLDLKFKWRHGIVRKFTHMVPVGEHKLQNVFALAISKGQENQVLKRDENGEIYVEKPIQLKEDRNFSVFGPFPTKNKDD